MRHIPSSNQQGWIQDFSWGGDRLEKIGKNDVRGRRPQRKIDDFSYGNQAQITLIYLIYSQAYFCRKLL